MYDCIWSVAGKSAVEICGIENVALKQGAPAGESGMSLGEIVECDRQEAELGQCLAGMTADEASATGDQDGWQVKQPSAYEREQVSGAYQPPPPFQRRLTPP